MQAECSFDASFPLITSSECVRRIRVVNFVEAHELRCLCCDVQVRTLRAGLKQHPRGVPAYGVAEALPRASDVEPVLALLAKVPVHVPGSSAARQQLMLLARPAPAAAGAMTAASSPGAPAHAASGAGGPLPGAPSASKGVLSATSESTARASSPLLSVRNSIGVRTFEVSDYSSITNHLMRR